MKYINIPEIELIAAYKSGITVTKLAKIYGVSRYVISARLSKNGVSLFKKGFFLRVCKNINEHYFDVIDAENKAYFLGLLYADGCNHNSDKRKKISISLQDRDKHILEEMSKSILDDIQINFIKRRLPSHKDQCSLTIHSHILSDKLVELGCASNKSLTLKFPEWLIDPELQRHFIRGYFDGDGSIGAYKRKNRKSLSYNMEITSTLDFCKVAADIIKQNVEINVLLRPMAPKINMITNKLYIKGNKQVIQALDWLYKDATIYLQRKYDKYLELKENQRFMAAQKVS